MKLNHFEDVNQYYQHVKSDLLQHEAHHNLIFGVIDGLINQPERLTNSPYLVTVEEDSRILVVALRTPPRKLVLSRSLHPQALNIIAQDLQARQAVIPGVMGLVDEALAFAQAKRGKPLQVSPIARVCNSVFISLKLYSLSRKLTAIFDKLPKQTVRY